MNNSDSWKVSEGSKRCGLPKDNCYCLLLKGHEGDHRCSHGWWTKPNDPKGGAHLVHTRPKIK